MNCMRDCRLNQHVYSSETTWSVSFSVDRSNLDQTNNFSDVIIRTGSDELHNIDENNFLQVNAREFMISIFSVTYAIRDIT